MGLTPQQKRLRTIRERYGSVKQMLAKRDVRDLILGGYNGGIKQAKKGYATWEKDKLKAFVKTRRRDSSGKFLPEGLPSEEKAEERRAEQ